MTSQRFSDKEVALILRRAVELEEASPPGDVPAKGGLTLEELREVAEEAGINPRFVTRAVGELKEASRLEPFSLAGPSTLKQEVRLVPGTPSREQLGDLMRVVDAEVAAPGTVVEALGAVRWTSTGRFLNTQVSVEPSEDETLLRVEERYSDAVRGPLHGIPAAWGLIIGLGVGLESLGLVLPVALVLAIVLGTVGWGVGDVVWRMVAARSGVRVRKLAGRLTEEAAGLLPPGEGVPEEEKESLASPE